MADRPATDFARLIRGHAGRRRLSDDVVRELAEHLDEIFNAELARGRTPDEASSTALAAIERSDFAALVARSRAMPADSRLLERTEENRALRGVPHLWDGVAFDLRFAWRSMRRQRAFTIAVVAILAVGIGATVSAFSVIDAVLLRALPYPDPGRLIILKHVTPAGETRSHAAKDWRDYAAAHWQSLTLAAYASWPMNVTGDGAPERLRSVIVSGNFFDVIGQRPALGRTSGVADDTPSAAGVVVLSDGLWRRRFGGDHSIVGRSILLNGRTTTVVGVMPASFAVPEQTVDLWMPMGLPPAVLDDRVSEWLSIVGRLRPGIDVRRVQADLLTTSTLLASTYPKTNADERVAVRPLLDEMVGGVRRALWLGGAAVLFVLLAGAANAANLMIARATMRRDELAIRAALGAEPARIARQLLIESLVLASCGGALGIGAALLFDRAFVAFADGRVPRIDQIHLNVPAIAIAVIAAAVAALICGGASAWLVVRRNRTDVERSAARVTASNRAGEILLACQLAFAFVLIAGSALVARGYVTTLRIDPGFDTSDTLTMQVTLPRGRYPDAEAHARFAQRAVEALLSMPGVTQAGVVSDLPLVGNALHFAVRADTTSGDGERMTVRPADAGFLNTLRIPLATGRLFTAQDRAGAELVALVNQAAARRLGSNGAVGSRIVVDREPPRTIVGVVGEIKHGGLRADEGPVVYVPFAQKTFDFANWMGLVVRGNAGVPSVAAVRTALANVDPNQPLSAVQPMHEYIDEETAPYRFSALIVFVLAGAALLLAVTGIFGMTAFVVGRRTRELGVRLALGAPRTSVVRLVLRPVRTVFLIGAVAGLLGAALTNRLLQSALADAPTLRSNAGALAAGGIVLLVTTLGAALLPALRAARIDPKLALQAE